MPVALPIDELTASGETLLLHLHTLIAAALARLAIRRSHPVKVLYMVHGLHFLPCERNADCLLFLSEREGLPMSVAEALASHLAVVAYGIRGVRDLLQGLNGWKVPESRTASAVAQAVQTALDTPIDVEAYRARARQFSLEASLDAHEAAVRQLMQTGLRGSTVTPGTPAGTPPQT